MNPFKLISIAAIASMMLLCCTKENHIEKQITRADHFTDVVLENKQKDEQVIAMSNARKGIKQCPGNNPHCQTPPPPPPPPVPTQGCILLDFDSHLTSGTLWNTSGDFYSAPSGMSASQIAIIFDSVKFDYAFNPGIKVTIDEAEFNTYPVNKRTRIVITTSNEWQPGVGGIAYINSFNWFSDEPAFVFSNALGFNIKNIAEAASHEAGHTLSLRHQSTWIQNEDGSWTKLADYDPGCCGWAPIMGVSYSANGIFLEGMNSAGQMQNDTAWINNSIRL